MQFQFSTFGMQCESMFINFGFLGKEKLCRRLGFLSAYLRKDEKIEFEYFRKYEEALY